MSNAATPSASTVPGWYGKLPTLGDFASRRLDADFIEPWDTWLGEGIAQQRQALGEDWLAAYLRSPAWRFMLMPGVLSPGQQTAMAGVLMPSVDRVGRYFPLTLVTSTPPPRSSKDVEMLLAWLHRLEDVAIDAVQDDWTIEQLDGALEQMPPVMDVAAATPEHLSETLSALVATLRSQGGFVPIDKVRSRAELADLFVGVFGGPPPTDSAGSGRRQAARGLAFWLADNPSQPQLLVSRGLPGHDDFMQMLGPTGREPGENTIY